METFLSPFSQLLWLLLLYTCIQGNSSQLHSKNVSPEPGFLRLLGDLLGREGEGPPVVASTTPRVKPSLDDLLVTVPPTTIPDIQFTGARRGTPGDLWQVKTGAPPPVTEPPNETTVKIIFPPAPRSEATLPPKQFPGGRRNGTGDEVTPLIVHDNVDVDVEVSTAPPGSPQSGNLQVKDPTGVQNFNLTDDSEVQVDIEVHLPGPPDAGDQDAYILSRGPGRSDASKVPPAPIYLPPPAPIPPPPPSPILPLPPVPYQQYPQAPYNPYQQGYGMNPYASMGMNPYASMGMNPYASMGMGMNPYMMGMMAQQNQTKKGYPQFKRPTSVNQKPGYCHRCDLRYGQFMAVPNMQVCGRDGLTYSNPCYAECNAPFALPFECEGECPCKVGAPGALTDQQTKWAPALCGNLYEPKCGSDGRSYPNQCYMQLYGKDLKCDGMCPCIDLTYKIDQTCPYKCAPYEKPLCGKDGRTYRNPCAAHCVKELAYPIKCYGRCPCLQLQNTTAQKPVQVGRSGVDSNIMQSLEPDALQRGPLNHPVGVVLVKNECLLACLKKAHKAKKKYKPVCGKDGVTYTSECAAQCNSVEALPLACQSKCPCKGGSKSETPAGGEDKKPEKGGDKPEKGGGKPEIAVKPPAKPKKGEAKPSATLAQKSKRSQKRKRSTSDDDDDDDNNKASLITRLRNMRKQVHKKHRKSNN